MAATQVRGAQMQTGTVLGAQIGDGSVQRNDLDASTPGSAVIRKAVQGTGIALTSTGGDAGTGDVTIALGTMAANTILANATSGVAAPTAVAVNASSIVGRGAIGNITNMTVVSPVIMSGTNITLDPAVDFAFTTPQTITLSNANLNTSDSVFRLEHNSTASPVAANFGITQWFRLENAAGTTNQDAGQFQCNWSTATAASETSYFDWLLRNAGAGLASKMRLHGSGGLSVGHTTDPLAGYISANTGFKIGATDIFPLTTARGGVPSGGTVGQALVKNSGTNYDVVWDTYTATQSAGRSATAGTTSTTGVHAGIADSFVPAITGRVLVICSGALKSSVAAAAATVLNIRYGTGTAPTHGAAPTGTIATGSNVAGHSATANYLLPFCLSAVVTGLTLGTTYWFDVVYLSSSGTSTAVIQGHAMSIVEI